LPEFAVEAVIAWQAGKDPSKTHLAIANFTGSLRLLVGLGWPMIYFVAAAFGWKREGRFISVELDAEHSVEVFGLLLPIAYFTFIWWKGTLTIWDALPLTIAASLGVSTFVFVQWVAPFLSEFPEKLSAFYWARKVRTANVALMNMVSSNINQWSILSAMIPILFVISAGELRPLRFDSQQRAEILLTILQSFLGFLLLLNLQLKLHEASILFVFWLVQFAVPSWRGPMIYVYLGWCVVELTRLIVSGHEPPAWRGLRTTLAERFA